MEKNLKILFRCVIILSGVSILAYAISCVVLMKEIKSEIYWLMLIYFLLCWGCGPAAPTNATKAIYGFGLWACFIVIGLSDGPSYYKQVLQMFQHQPSCVSMGGFILVCICYLLVSVMMFTAPYCLSAAVKAQEAQEAAAKEATTEDAAEEEITEEAAKEEITEEAAEGKTSGYWNTHLPPLRW